jgi:hypothetical protein
MADKKAIGGLVKLIASLGVDYIEPRLERALVDGSLTEKLALSPFDAIRESINALSDDNAENTKQVGAIWIDYLRNKVRVILMDALAPIIGEIDNVTDRALVQYLADIANEIVGILTDDEQNNKQQIAAYLEGLKLADRTRDVFVAKLIALADGVVKDKALLKAFNTILAAIFDVVQGKQLSSDTLEALGHDIA